MDIYCIKCGEPVEIDTLHDIAEDTGETFADTLHRFQLHGCEGLDGWYCNRNVDKARAHAAAFLYDILGDDIDGAASMMETFERQGHLAKAEKLIAQLAE